MNEQSSHHVHTHEQYESVNMQVGEFPRDPAGLPEAGRPALLKLAHGDTLDLRVAPVAKRLADTNIRMLAYNGSIPGPTLKVQQGSEIIVRVTNQGDLDTTASTRVFNVRLPGAQMKLVGGDSGRVERSSIRCC